MSGQQKHPKTKKNIILEEKKRKKKKVNVQSIKVRCGSPEVRTQRQQYPKFYFLTEMANPAQPCRVGVSTFRSKVHSDQRSKIQK